MWQILSWLYKRDYSASVLELKGVFYAFLALHYVLMIKNDWNNVISDHDCFTRLCITNLSAGLYLQSD